MNRYLNGRTAASLCAAAALLPMLAIAWSWRFDGLYGADSIAYFQYATGPLRESLLGWTVPPPFFWPLGFPLLVAVASLVVGATPAAGQLVAMAAAATIPVATWWLARPVATDLGGAERAPRVALIAGGLTAVTGQLWQSGIVVMADTTGVACATISAAVLAQYAARPSARRAAVASGTLAAGVLARWGNALLVLPWAAVVLLSGAGRRVKDGAVAVVSGLALLAAQAALALAVDGADAPWQGAPFAGDLAVYLWDPLNAFRRVFDTVDGQLAYAAPNGWYYLSLPFYWVYLTPLVAPLALMGAVRLLRARAWTMAALVLGWPLIFIVFHAGAPWQNVRFALSYLPPLALLAALECDRWLAGASATRRRLWTFLLVVILLTKAAAGIWLCRDFIARKDQLVATVRWTEARVPDDGALLTFNLTAMFQQYSRLDTREFYYLSADDVISLAGTGQPVFLLIDVANVESQWRDEGPGRAYRTLLDAGRLDLVGTTDGVTLFRLTDDGR